MVGGGGGQAAMSPAPSGGKRGRGPEEDVYVDNLHSHKRYLTEFLQIMASSMNGLSVGDSVADNIMVSPVRLENASCFRDEIGTRCSPMSEESDDYRYYDTQANTNGSQTDVTSSPSNSPISSPHRFLKPHTLFSSVNPYPLTSCSLSAVACHLARRGSEHEGPIPSSPNDMCHGGDLRRSALLRSVQMRVQGPHPCDLLSSSEQGQDQERGHMHVDEVDHDKKQAKGLQLDQRSFSCSKSIQDAEYQRPANCSQRSDRDVDFVEDQITA